MIDDATRPVDPHSYREGASPQRQPPTPRPTPTAITNSAISGRARTTALMQPFSVNEGKQEVPRSNTNPVKIRTW